MLPITVGQNVTSAVPPGVTIVTDVTDPLTTVSSTSQNEVYLDPTVSGGSPLNLLAFLDIHSSFEMSFRSCTHGSLLSQTGGDQQNYFQLVLDKSGSLNISWSSASASNSVLLGRDLNDNRWYKFVWNYQDLQNVTVSIEQNGNVLYQVEFSNATFSQGLWNMNLLNGSELHFGDGSFEGCLRDGPQMWFLAAAEYVEWNNCRSETRCDRTVDTDSCSSSPCANNGRFDNCCMLWWLKNFLSVNQERGLLNIHLLSFHESWNTFLIVNI